MPISILYHPRKVDPHQLKTFQNSLTQKSAPYYEHAIFDQGNVNREVGYGKKWIFNFSFSFITSSIRKSFEVKYSNTAMNSLTMRIPIVGLFLPCPQIINIPVIYITKKFLYS